jgi:putative ABC transport system permease protein
MLAKNPVFTVAAVITLAAGIGLNTAIFSVINSVILQPLPYREPDRLVQVWERNLNKAIDNGVVSPSNFLEWRKQAKSFESLSAYNIWRPSLTGAGDATRLAGAVVTADFFSTLGVMPQLGRTFSPEEEYRDKNRVVIISYDFWQTRLGGKLDIIGETLTLDEASYIIIGVLRPDYRHPEPFFAQRALLWRPLNLAERDLSLRYLRVIGRLKPGFTRDRTQAEMSTIAQQLQKSNPASNTGWDVNVVALNKQIIGDFSFALFVLQAAVAFVLLIACANVANLLLARGATRKREIAIRSALGASRTRLVLQLLTENTLLAGLGGVMGLVLAFVGVKYLVSLAPKDIPRLEDIRLNGQVLGFTILVSLLTILLFAFVPSWQAAKANLSGMLREGGRNAQGGRRSRDVLVIAEIALSLVLLTGAGLMLRSLLHLQDINLGFNPANLLTMRIDLPRSESREDNQVISFYQQALASLETVPGVESASITTSLPLEGLNNLTVDVLIEGQQAPEQGNALSANYRIISPGYFSTLSVPLIKGRGFTDGDRKDSYRVAIINEAFARLYFSDADPISRKIISGVESNTPREIVGIVGDFKQEGLATDVKPEMYVPYAQKSSPSVALVVRTSTDPANLTAAVQNATRENKKNVAISMVRTMRQALTEAISRQRFNMILLGIFSSLALILAAVGIYSITSYTVTRRTHEIGIRIALGAQPSEIARLIVGQGMLLTLIGTSIGVAVALGLTRLLARLLYGVTASDPITFIIVALMLSGVAMIASYLPARRAMKVDPLIALRYE